MTLATIALAGLLPANDPLSSQQWKLQAIKRAGEDSLRVDLTRAGRRLLRRRRAVRATLVLTFRPALGQAATRRVGVRLD